MDPSRLVLHVARTVALAPSVSCDIQFVGNVKTALSGGEGVFFASRTGRSEEGSALDGAGLGRLHTGG